ncbi:unnamed protein product [Linum tenue]|uniref:Aminotransferase-like plant mobile domain-containing protein n=1 Tax=Linum tenue TaxID=586396 RepID=A0AAV0RMU8_9ROSI|nr:unnamed protein product [Linum tenue]
MGPLTAALGVGAIPTSDTATFGDEGADCRGCIPTWCSMLPSNTRQYGDQLFQYKLWFDEMETMVWQPYVERALHLRGSVIQSETFRAVVPLICFSAVMWHHPHRVLR